MEVIMSNWLIWLIGLIISSIITIIMSMKSFEKKRNKVFNFDINGLMSFGAEDIICYIAGAFSTGFIILLIIAIIGMIINYAR